MNLTEKSPLAMVWDQWISSRNQPPRPLQPIRNFIENFPITTVNHAHRICGLIPAQCPFARTIKLRDKVLMRIPPLCKVNPFYDELMMLRFRAMNYLVEAGEDIGAYC